MDHPDVLTGDSFFHLSALGEALPGLNLCGAGRVVCLIDPVGDVYACPFVLHDEFLAGSVRSEGGFQKVWQESDLFTELREPQSAGACASCGHFDVPGAVWRPSSSPASRSTAPTPSVCSATRPRWTRWLEPRSTLTTAVPRSRSAPNLRADHRRGHGFPTRSHRTTDNETPHPEPGRGAYENVGC